MDSTKVVGTIVMSLLVVVLAAVIMAWPTQLLWNGCLVPAVDGVHEIGFWQALGLNVLFHLLFKSTSTTTKKD